MLQTEAVLGTYPPFFSLVEESFCRRIMLNIRRRTTMKDIVFFIGGGGKNNRCVVGS